MSQFHVWCVTFRAALSRYLTSGVTLMHSGGRTSCVSWMWNNDWRRTLTRSRKARWYQSTFAQLLDIIIVKWGWFKSLGTVLDVSCMSSTIEQFKSKFNLMCSWWEPEWLLHTHFSPTFVFKSNKWRFCLCLKLIEWNELNGLNYCVMVCPACMAFKNTSN